MEVSTTSVWLKRSKVSYNQLPGNGQSGALGLSKERLDRKAEEIVKKVNLGSIIEEQDRIAKGERKVKPEKKFRLRKTRTHSTNDWGCGFKDLVFWGEWGGSPEI